MGMTDPFATALKAFEEESKLDGGSEALIALITLVPIAGGPASSLIAGHVKRKMAARIMEVFEAFNDRMEQVDKKLVDKAFFRSDEFLTLFMLALEQIRTTHNKAKLGMLAIGLANSATFEFASESRKELFVRILRDLAPEHLSILNELRPTLYNGRKAVRRPIASPSGDRLVVLQHLVSQGLVTETLHVERMPTVNLSHPAAQNMLKSYIETPPSKKYILSDFGVQFLQFFESESAKRAESAPKDSEG
jgi:hypothetical protein